MAMPKIVVFGNQLVYYDQFGFSHPYDCASGRPGETNRRKSDVGPIPLGKYVMKVDDIAGGWLYFIYWKIKQEDWGVYRVPLKPMEGTDVLNEEKKSRYGFSLHGGTEPGTAGCIEVRTPNDLALFALLKLSFQETIELEVLGYGDYNIIYNV